MGRRRMGEKTRRFTPQTVAWKLRTAHLEENVCGRVRVVPLRGPPSPRSSILLGLLDHCIAVFAGKERGLCVVHQILGVKRKVIPFPDNVGREFDMLKVVIGKV